MTTRQDPLCGSPEVVEVFIDQKLTLEDPNKTSCYNEDPDISTATCFEIENVLKV
jgi:hypothetical protein